MTSPALVHGHSNERLDPFLILEIIIAHLGTSSLRRTFRYGAPVALLLKNIIPRLFVSRGLPNPEIPRQLSIPFGVLSIVVELDPFSNLSGRDLFPSRFLMEVCTG